MAKNDIFESMPFNELRQILNLKDGEQVTTSTGRWSREGKNLIQKVA
jgi:hypothetical protein